MVEAIGDQQKAIWKDKNLHPPVANEISTGQASFLKALMERCDRIHEGEGGYIEPREPRLLIIYRPLGQGWRGRSGMCEAPFLWPLVST